MTIIYLHGFGSKGNSFKSQQLRKEFGNENVVSPDLPLLEPEKMVKLIDDVVYQVKSFPIIFVGTSLGGFWANYFSARWDAPCILINPVIDPIKTLKNHNIQNSIVEKYKELSFPDNYLNMNILLAKDDTVLNANETYNLYKKANSIIMTDTGGHRYEDQWSNVIDKIKEICS